MSQSNVDEDYLQIIRFFLWLSENGEVTDFLSGKTDNAYQPEYVKIEAYNTVLMQANSMFRSGFLEKCLISSSKGYLSFGSRTGMLSDQKLCWSGTAPIPAQERVCVVDSPFDANGGSVVRMVNEVYSSMSGKQIGWVNVYLNTDFIVNQFSGQFQENAPLFLGIGDGLYEIKSDGLRFIGPVEAVEYEVLETLTGGVALANGKLGGFEGDFLLSTSAQNGWRYFRTLPPITLWELEVNEFYTPIGIAVLMLLFGLLLVLILTLIINKPIAKICACIDRIAQGDFRYDPTIETADELGHIGRGINSMAQNIQKLLETAKRTEREKKDHEFRALQNQINPHFLYNALNSIKWMAVLQKANGIAEMTTSLGHMLRNALRIEQGTVSLKEELEILKDYATVQQYRYGDAFRLSFFVEDPELYRARIVKLTLQPLVENAIFHGVDVQKGTLEIRVSARRQAQDLILEIRDNGMGIEAQKLAELQRSIAGDANAGESIGLANVQRRIQLEYGEGYGLKMESVLGAYTAVTICTPLILLEKESEA